VNKLVLYAWLSSGTLEFCQFVEVELSSTVVISYSRLLHATGLDREARQ